MVHGLGTINHVTPNISQLTATTNYKGNEHLQVGNDESLHITHVGHVFVPSQIHSKAFYLKKFLCVPHRIKNLLSISKITKDNHIVVEFYDDKCVVKDNISGNTVVRAPQGWLYQLGYLST